MQTPNAAGRQGSVSFAATIRKLGLWLLATQFGNAYRRPL